jgi:hypothetical protein
MLWIQHVILFTSTIWISTWRKSSCLQTLRRFYGVTTFSRYPLVEIILFENQDDLCLLWDLGFWILTSQPFNSYTLAYCRPFHLISIGFQYIDNNPGSPPKNFFFPFKFCYYLVIYAISLSEIFLQAIRIVRYKILWVKAIKDHLIYPTYQ